MRLKLIAAAAFMTLAPSAASAADYLIYSFAITGGEFRISNDQPGYGYSGPVSGMIVYHLPTSFSGATSATASLPGYAPQGSDIISVSLVSNVLSLQEVLTGPYRASTRNVTINTCLVPGIPGPTITVNPSCSSVNLIDAVSLGTRGGDLREISGTVTGLTITEGFGSAGFGLVSYPVMALTNPLPEPATWAMMIIGMGAVGYAMRRRQRVFNRFSIA